MNKEKEQFNADELSIITWIFKNNIVSEKGDLLDFRDRLFLLDILSAWPVRQQQMADHRRGIQGE